MFETTILSMTKRAYGFSKATQLAYDEAIPRITEELRREGFGILTEIDVKDTLKKKLGVDFTKYKILGACNPTLAHRALGLETEIGLFMPCNVIVYEADGGKTVVSIVDPNITVKNTENKSLEPLAKEAAERLKRAVHALP